MGGGLRCFICDFCNSDTLVLLLLPVVGSGWCDVMLSLGDDYAPVSMADLAHRRAVFTSRSSARSTP